MRRRRHNRRAETELMRIIALGSEPCWLLTQLTGFSVFKSTEIIPVNCWKYNKITPFWAKYFRAFSLPFFGDSRIEFTCARNSQNENSRSNSVRANKENNCAATTPNINACRGVSSSSARPYIAGTTQTAASGAIRAIAIAKSRIIPLRAASLRQTQIETAFRRTLGSGTDPVLSCSQRRGPWRLFAHGKRRDVWLGMH